MSPPSTNTEFDRLRPIGRVSSSLRTRADCPRQPDEDAPPATLLIDPDVRAAIAGLEVGSRIIVLTWLDLANRETLTNHPRGDAAREPKGVFATRSEDRPNPIGVHSTTVTSVDGARIEVAQLEAIDGTPILDIKPALGPIPSR